MRTDERASLATHPFIFTHLDWFDANRQSDANFGCIGMGRVELLGRFRCRRFVLPNDVCRFYSNRPCHIISCFSSVALYPYCTWYLDYQSIGPCCPAFSLLSSLCPDKRCCDNADLGGSRNYSKPPLSNSATIEVFYGIRQTKQNYRKGLSWVIRTLLSIVSCSILSNPTVWLQFNSFAVRRHPLAVSLVPNPIFSFHRFFRYQSHKINFPRETMTRNLLLAVAGVVFLRQVQLL